MTHLRAFLATAIEIAAWWTAASLTAGAAIARIGYAFHRRRPTPSEHR